MIKSLACALAIVSPILLVSTPAFATKGIDAARTCEATPGCRVTYMPGGDIYLDYNGKTIYCDGPKAECIVMIRGQSGGPASAVDGVKQR